DVARQRGALIGGKASSVPDLPRADLANAEMGRQAGGAGTIRPVARGGIANDAIFQEGGEAGVCRGFTRGPGLAQSAGPLRVSPFEAPVSNCVACKAGYRAECFR